jgi:hypothetical protein
VKVIDTVNVLRFLIYRIHLGNIEVGVKEL